MLELENQHLSSTFAITLSQKNHKGMLNIVGEILIRKKLPLYSLKIPTQMIPINFKVKIVPYSREPGIHHLAN